ncbi:glycoside hydrolase family 71 protein [Delitschia confertaspora ATCC 74209]|uniref:Glycoside hydrolase family 71 protein n=1 Tax=Delitschia confertaspora ATCC 74209 TaxID=1513339 RepID=A0A9P4JUX1_9PLEO|nr:glycoside hydrolase family 71 protein [Delitschia confertaspora ATCC 74209]
MYFSSWSFLAGSLLAALTTAAPSSNHIIEKRDANNQLVFAHFMVGIVANRNTAADYDDDMKRAKAYGIDAFAMNIGRVNGDDTYNYKQLDLAYQSAVNNGMKLFISFDGNYFTGGDAALIGSYVKKYGNNAAQLKVDNKVFVSTFNGDAIDPATVRSSSGMDLYYAPNYHPWAKPTSDGLDGAFNWMGWDNDGYNKAPKDGRLITVSQGDTDYKNWLAGKGYIAPVSPWFNTHYGTEVSYSKNWVFPSDLLWYNRWNQILALKPRFLEIISWNDYGESHYIGPLASKHTDDGNSKWVNDMPHNGWLEMAKPFIAAYKAGASSPNSYITADQLVYWYRPVSKNLNCDATDTCDKDSIPGNENYFKGKPDGWNSMEDSVFVVALLKSAGTVTVSSGSNTASFNAPAGASSWKVNMGVGQQKFSLVRGGQTVLSDTSLRDISDVCPCGIYNFNAYVGTVPAGARDVLGPDALTGFMSGLKVSTCQAAPSLKTQ